MIEQICIPTISKETGIDYLILIKQWHNIYNYHLTLNPQLPPEATYHRALQGYKTWIKAYQNGEKKCKSKP